MLFLSKQRGVDLHRGMTLFLAESCDRSSRNGMTYGCSIDYESQKIKKILLSNTLAEWYSFMKCFGSCQFLHGSWMDISVEVAKIHMRSDAVLFHRKLIRTISALFAFNSSNSNRILSSRELIILSDSNFGCVCGSCAVCCGLFSHEDRHTARTQHSTGTHSTVIIFRKFVLQCL